MLTYTSWFVVIFLQLQSSDEEAPAEEEAEALRLQRLKAASLRPEDFEFSDQEDDMADENERSLQVHYLVGGKTTSSLYFLRALKCFPCHFLECLIVALSWSVVHSGPLFDFSECDCLSHLKATLCVHL
jgi:hypothetical protein